MRISEVVKQSGIPASTLRYYEEIGLIPAPKRVNGQRDYDSTIFEVLDKIQLAQNAGFTLREICELMQGDRIQDRWKPMARQKLIEVQRTIQTFQAIEQTLQDSLMCPCDEGGICVYFSA